MRLLVTGASGLLGMNLALEAGREHVVVGQVNRCRLRTDAFQVATSDLTEAGAVAALVEASRPDAVIHCAALADVDSCERDPQLATKLNDDVPGLIAERTAALGLPLIYVSTDAVFDGEDGAYVETDAPNPLSVYARTKLAGERRVAQADPKAIIARVNLFGWSARGGRSLAEFFFNRLSSGFAVRGFNDVWFCPLLATDLSRLFMRMLDSGLQGLYHVVSPECLTKYDFGVRIAELFGLDARLIEPISVEAAGLGACRSRNLTLGIGKLARDLPGGLPDVSSGLRGLHRQRMSGYPTLLRGMIEAQSDARPGDSAGVGQADTATSIQEGQ